MSPPASHTRSNPCVPNYFHPSHQNVSERERERTFQQAEVLQDVEAGRFNGLLLTGYQAPISVMDANGVRERESVGRHGV